MQKKSEYIFYSLQIYKQTKLQNAPLLMWGLWLVIMYKLGNNILVIVRIAMYENVHSSL